MYLLDTNVVSELRRPEKADPRVRAWAGKVAVGDFYLSAVTILEIELGTLLMERKDAVYGQALRTWIDQEILPRFEGRILPVDTLVALRCAGLHVPDPRGERDALIAATAMVHGMTVVTRNIADFTRTGVPVLDPWA